MSEPTANESLPAIVDRAGHRLLEAKSSAEVLEAKAMAEAALHYAKITKAANETHADCIRIITRAEMRMANEIDAEKAAGNLRGVGNPNQIQRDAVNSKTTYADIGIAQQRVAEWRDVRDAGEQVVDGVISKALSKGQAPKLFHANHALTPRSAVVCVRENGQIY